jgi:hypothetical protein
MRDRFEYSNSTAANKTKNVEELKSFLRSVSPYIAKLEDFRISCRNKIFFRLAPAIGVCFILAFVTAQTGSVLRIFWPIPLIFSLFFVHRTFQIQKQYRREFKTKFLRPAMVSYFQGMTYDPNLGIDRGTFDRSELFGRIDRYQSEDLVRCKSGESQIEFAEVFAERRVQRNKRQSSETVFRGVFMRVSHKNLDLGRTLILPDLAESLLGPALGGLFQRLHAGLSLRSSVHLLKVDHKAFEKKYVVYTAEPEKAARLFSPDFAQRILNLTGAFDRKVPILLHKGEVAIALWRTRSYLEPSLSSPVRASTTEFLECVAFLMDLANELIAIADHADVFARDKIFSVAINSSEVS